MKFKTINKILVYLWAIQEVFLLLFVGVFFIIDELVAIILCLINLGFCFMLGKAIHINKEKYLKESLEKHFYSSGITQEATQDIAKVMKIIKWK